MMEIMQSDFEPVVLGASMLHSYEPLSQHLLPLWLISVAFHLVSVLVRGGAQHAPFRIEYLIFAR